MTHPKYPSFDAVVDQWSQVTLPIPNRIGNIIEGAPIVKVHRGNEPKVYSVQVRFYPFGTGADEHFGRGWSKFMVENDIQQEDLLEITYQGDNYFHVVVFRGGIEIRSVDQPDVIDISSSTDGNPNDGDDSDDGGSGELAGHPEFTTRFTQPYIKVGRLNVPLAFARTHLDSLGPETAVDVWMRNTKYTCTLYVKRDRGGVIRLCNIRNGIAAMIREWEIMNENEIVVKLSSKSPPAFKLSFA